MYIAIPISEIIIGVTYKTNLLCFDNNDNGIINSITLDKWLIIDGSVSTCFFFLILCWSISSENTQLNCCSICLLYLLNFVNLTWTIIGSYIFFGSCNKIVPESLNIYMIVIFTVSYISLCNNLVIHHNSKSDKKVKKNKNKNVLPR
jgi:hypothetical protein